MNPPKSRRALGHPRRQAQLTGVSWIVVLAAALAASEAWAAEVTVSGGAGYGGFFRLCGSGQGLAYSGAMELKWPGPGQRYALGLRVGGYHRDAINAQPSGCKPSDEDQTAREPFSEPFWGLNAAFLIEARLTRRHHLWTAPGFGVAFDILTVPEAVLSAGYRFQLTRNFGLHLGIEGGTWLWKYRGAVLGGLAVTL